MPWRRPKPPTTTRNALGQPIPTEVKVVDQQTLFDLIDTANRRGRGTRLTSDWVAANCPPRAQAWVKVVLIEKAPPRGLRCSVVLPTRDGARAAHLLDITPEDFVALPTMSTAQLMAFAHEALDDAPFVRSPSRIPGPGTDA